MIILRAFLIIVSLLGGCTLAIAQTIDDEVVRNIDLTGNGKPGIITLRPSFL